jgi:hypothetical protein
MSTFASACQQWEADEEYKVFCDTWGHLAPKKNKTYKGYVIWALGCFGSDRLNPTPIMSQFRGLDSSPWFYNLLIDFLHAHSKKEGKIFRFDGTFKNYVFTGKIQELTLTKKKK